MSRLTPPLNAPTTCPVHRSQTVLKEWREETQRLQREARLYPELGESLLTHPPLYSFFHPPFSSFQSSCLFSSSSSSHLYLYHNSITSLLLSPTPLPPPSFPPTPPSSTVAQPRASEAAPFATDHQKPAAGKAPNTSPAKENMMVLPVSEHETQGLISHPYRQWRGSEWV